MTTADGELIFKFNLNNKLRQYNYLDYLFSQEYLISTVGSHIAHPDKNKIDEVLEFTGLSDTGKKRATK